MSTSGQHKFVWVGVGQVGLLEILCLVLGPYGKHVGEYLWRYPERFRIQVSLEISTLLTSDDGER